ncbi:MAG: outer membrane beta-barrel protein [Bacteroidetes bacterium]|nr:outer membrane beta-barrel protein [Bacteroidota bacterium]
MKKILIAMLLVFAVTGISNAQNHTSFKPSLQVIARGSYSVPLSHQDFKDNVSGFPGAQIELAYDFSPCWGVYGNLSADFISAKNSTLTTGGTTTTQKTAMQFPVFIGPRYYINMKNAHLWKIYADVGAGLYGTKPGDITTTTSLGTSTTTQDANSQFGFNAGAGANVVVGSRMIVTFGAKYHFVMKSSDALVSGTTTDVNGVSSSYSISKDLSEYSYLQFNAGVGFRF